MNAGAGTVGFSVYDRATNTWTARSVANLPTTWGTDAQLVSTPGRSSQQGNGFVNGTATGGTAPYSGTGSFTVGAGSYTYTVTDANGCSTTTSITVSEPTALSASSSQGASILCNGGTTTVTVSATGGTAPYSGDGSFTVGAGSYTYTVTDANG